MTDVETVARALCKADGHNPDVWAEGRDGVWIQRDWRAYRKLARAALAAATPLIEARVTAALVPWLREAAAAVVARWDTPAWKSAAIERLRDVLTKQEYEHMTPTVLVHYDAEGEQSFKISGDVTLIIVDERSPHDRAYHYREQTPIAEIMAIVGDEIGSSDDQQHLALAHKIERAANGRPALSLVPTRETDA